MDTPDRAGLTEFARSLISRARVESDEAVPQVSRSLPQNTSNQALHAALSAQHDLIEVLSARLTAEIGVMMAAVERLERELAVTKGQVSRAADQQSSQKAEVQRALTEIRDLADLYIERLTEHFERRLRALV